MCRVLQRGRPGPSFLPANWKVHLTVVALQDGYFVTSARCRSESELSPVRCTTNILTRLRQLRSREQGLNKVRVAYRRHPQRNQRRQPSHEKQNPLRRHFVVGAVITPRPKHQRPTRRQRDLITPGAGPRSADGRLGSFDAPRMRLFFRMDIFNPTETTPADPPAGQTTPP